jgi:2-dehydropantoate 2-reductase
VAVIAREHITDTLHQGPIRLDLRRETQTVSAPPTAVEPHNLPAEFQQPDLAILCIKSYDTEAALPTLSTLQPWQVLSLQNGLGNEELLIREFGAERVLSGIITSSVETIAPGHVRVTRQGGIGIAGAGDPPRMRVWSAVFGKAGFGVREYADYRAVKWSKVLLNMLANATPAILDMPVHQVYADPRLVRLERRAFCEALDVMQRMHLRPVNLPGYPVVALAHAMRHLPEGMLFALLRWRIAGGRGGKLPSLHIDLRRGRTVSEGRVIYGAIAEAARAHGIAAPVNAALWQTLHDIASGAAGWDSFRAQPARLLEQVSMQEQAQS